MTPPQPLPDGPVTREQLDAFSADMMAWAAARGRAAGRAVRGQSTPPPALSPAEWDAKERASLAIQAGFRAELIMMLDDQDRLAACDRSDLVAEAMMSRLPR